MVLTNVICVLGAILWTYGYFVVGHQSALGWASLAPSWIAEFIPNREADWHARHRCGNARRIRPQSVRLLAKPLNIEAPVTRRCRAGSLRRMGLHWCNPKPDMAHGRLLHF